MDFLRRLNGTTTVSRYYSIICRASTIRLNYVPSEREKNETYVVKVPDAILDGGPVVGGGDVGLLRTQ
jgi:hypothetical protein